MPHLPRLAPLVAVLAALVVAGPALADGTPTGGISGTLTDETTGQAVSGICATATDGTGTSSAPSPASGPDGSYTIPSLADGAYTVTFTPCASGVAYETKTLSPVAVFSGQGTQDAALKPTSISGTVTDAITNQPVSGICVTSDPVLAANASGAPLPTGVDGRYQLSGVPEGTYTLTFAPCSGQAYRPTTAQVTVGSGQSATQDATVAPSFGSIGGTVTDANGDLIPGVSVTASTPGSPPTPPVTTGPDGSFNLEGLAPGTYALTFGPPAGYVLMIRDAVSVTAGHRTDLSIELKPTPPPVQSAPVTPPPVQPAPVTPPPSAPSLPPATGSTPGTGNSVSIGTLQLLKSVRSSTTQFKRQLARLTAASLARRGTASAPFAWLVPGRMQVTLAVDGGALRRVKLPGRGPAVTIGAATVTRGTAGTARVVVRLTKTGRTFLRRTGKPRLVLTTVLSPARGLGPPVAAQQGLRLR